ncbi:MAG: putative protein of unknown function acetylesterase [Phycisphaerales bacterium]|nr:putative protein of unknown function acetylesterase [Phycisphaerales bacterium]
MAHALGTVGKGPRVAVALAFATAASYLAGPASQPASLPTSRPTRGSTARTELVLAGWTVRVADRLWADDKPATDRMLALLADQLAGVAAAVPAPAIAELRKVPLWVSPEYPGTPPRAEYHPDAGWLRRAGRDPAMAKGVEFTNVRVFEREARRMPALALHELAHAYHDRVLGFDRPDVAAAYAAAVAGGRYDRVERSFGDPGRPHAVERAYAMTNAREYFAECTEAYFGRNDFYPFDRADLRRQDPDVARLLPAVLAGPPSPPR